jgi:hypothetical protein
MNELITTIISNCYINALYYQYLKDNKIKYGIASSCKSLIGKQNNLYYVDLILVNKKEIQKDIKKFLYELSKLEKIIYDKNKLNKCFIKGKSARKKIYEPSHHRKRI